MVMRNVVVVDDDTITLELLQHILEEFVSGQIRTFSSSIEALRFIQQTDRDSIDLIISDWNMPGLNGIQFLQKCRMRAPSTPFLMLTATATRELVAESKQLGVSDFIVKPFKNAEFTDKVMRLIMDDE